MLKIPTLYPFFLLLEIYPKKDKRHVYVLLLFMKAFLIGNSKI